MPYLPIGWTRDALAPELEPLAREQRLSLLLGELERTTWPLAKAGFFKVKQAIEPVLREVGIPGSPSTSPA
jgi:hypothetical protein